MKNHDHFQNTSENLPIECIVLAGGLGTRLRSSVPDLPKCMAPVSGKPFLQHIIDYLLAQGVTKFIFSLGYKHEIIEAFLQTEYPFLSYKIALEKDPLGTGGAIYLSCKQTTEKDVLIVNGDTLFKVNLPEMIRFHFDQSSTCTIALKPMQNIDRYGVIEMNDQDQIQSFQEKKHYPHGLINGGIYLLHVADFIKLEFPDIFSFEKDYLEKYYSSLKMCGFAQDNYFIDIGIPEDFERANREIH